MRERIDWSFFLWKRSGEGGEMTCVVDLVCFAGFGIGFGRMEGMGDVVHILSHGFTERRHCRFLIIYSMSVRP